LAYVTVAALILAPWLSASGWLGHRPMHVAGIYWVLIAVAASGVWLVFATVLRGDPENTFRDVGATMVVIVYVGLLGSFATQLRCSQDIPAQEGAWLLLILVFVTKCSDIGAYFVGSAIGRHKLAPTISPGKSIEGTLGGLAASALAATVIAFSGASESFRLATGIGSGFSAAWQPAAFGIIVAVSAQTGDLFESCFKRDAGSKDSGQIFPRFGGILDLLDSLLPTLAVGWFLLTTVWRIG
jgi:phosphatidate cytidylyltransferase